MSRLPTLNGLQAFEATARHMSFAEAAKELSLTPSAVSYQVRTLEDRLGVDLFERLNRAIALTEAGALLMPDVRDAFARLHQGVSRLSADTPDEILIVSTGPSFASKWLAPRLFSFLDAHPDIEVRISASLKLVDFNRDGVDVGIRFGPGNYPGLELTKLMGESVIPMAAPSFWAKHPVSSPADLLALPLIIDESMDFSPDAPSWRDWFAAAGVTGAGEPRGVHFNHADHAMDAAARGSGVVLGRTTLASDDVQKGLLEERFPEQRLHTPFAFYLVMPPTAKLKPKVAAFRDWLVAETGADAGSKDVSARNATAT
jgi:LysR family glycine cleavage system transcriptional activator